MKLGELVLRKMVVSPFMHPLVEHEVLDVGRCVVVFPVNGSSILSMVLRNVDSYLGVHVLRGQQGFAYALHCFIGVREPCDEGGVVVDLQDAVGEEVWSLVFFNSDLSLSNFGDRYENIEGDSHVVLVAVSCIYTLHSADKDSQSTAKYRRFLENVALQASLGSRTGSWLLSLAVLEIWTLPEVYEIWMLLEDLAGPMLEAGPDGELAVPRCKWDYVWGSWPGSKAQAVSSAEAFAYVGNGAPLVTRATFEEAFRLREVQDLARSCSLKLKQTFGTAEKAWQNLQSQPSVKLGRQWTSLQCGQGDFSEAQFRLLWNELSPCPAKHYRKTPLLFTCKPGSGRARLMVSSRRTEKLADIPAGIVNLRIAARAKEDFAGCICMVVMTSLWLINMVWYVMLIRLQRILISCSSIQTYAGVTLSFSGDADAEEVIEMRGTLDRPLIVEVNNFGKTAAADSASRFGSASRPPAPQTPKCTGHDRRLVSSWERIEENRCPTVPPGCAAFDEHRTRVAAKKFSAWLASTYETEETSDATSLMKVNRVFLMASEWHFVLMWILKPGEGMGRSSSFLRKQPSRPSLDSIEHGNDARSKVFQQLAAQSRECDMDSRKCRGEGEGGFWLRFPSMTGKDERGSSGLGPALFLCFPFCLKDSGKPGPPTAWVEFHGRSVSRDVPPGPVRTESGAGGSLPSRRQGQRRRADPRVPAPLSELRQFRRLFHLGTSQELVHNMFLEAAEHCSDTSECWKAAGGQQQGISQRQWQQLMQNYALQGPANKWADAQGIHHAGPLGIGQEAQLESKMWQVPEGLRAHAARHAPEDGEATEARRIWPDWVWCQRPGPYWDWLLQTWGLSDLWEVSSSAVPLPAADGGAEKQDDPQVVEGAGDVPAGDPPEGRAGSQKACLGMGVLSSIIRTGNQDRQDADDEAAADFDPSENLILLKAWVVSLGIDWEKMKKPAGAMRAKKAMKAETMSASRAMKAMKAMKVVPKAKAAKAMKAMKAMKAVKAKKKPAAVKAMESPVEFAEPDPVAEMWQTRERKAMESPVEFAEPDPVAEMWQTRERARRFKEKQDAIRARLHKPAVSDTSEEQEKQVDDTVGASRMRQEVLEDRPALAGDQVADVGADCCGYGFVCLDLGLFV
eukprot:s6509_g2.t1